MKWKVEDYLETLKNPNAWFRRAFEQKFVADKILADVILNRDFIRSQKANNDFTKSSGLWANALFHYGIGIENGLKGVIVKNQPELIVYGFHILDVMEPVFGYFRSLQDPEDEDEDYLWAFFKTKEKEVEERMGEMVPAEMRREQ